MQSDDRIAQCHDKRLVADQRPRTKNGVPQTELPPLPRVEILHLVPLELQVHQLLLASRLTQVRGQLLVNVEVLLDRSLAARRDEQDAPDAGQAQFFDDVLHDRLASDRQHLLGLTLRGRQQPRAVPGHRYNCDIDGHVQTITKWKWDTRTQRYVGECIVA